MSHTNSYLKLGIGAGLTALITALPATAAAQEQSTIKNPGAHPDYIVEVEPHFALAYAPPFDGVGVGGRVNFPVLKNGFIPSINNNVAVGAGLDWVHGNGCYGFYCRGADSFWVPVVMQWNFFLSPHWSVFAEPGVAIAHASRSALCAGRDAFGNPVYVDCGDSVTSPEPVLTVGGRFHVSDRFALTMRVGYPYITLGGSIM